MDIRADAAVAMSLRGLDERQMAGSTCSYKRTCLLFTKYPSSNDALCLCEPASWARRGSTRRACPARYKAEARRTLPFSPPRLPEYAGTHHKLSSRHQSSVEEAAPQLLMREGPDAAASQTLVTSSPCGGRSPSPGRNSDAPSGSGSGDVWDETARRNAAGRNTWSNLLYLGLGMRRVLRCLPTSPLPLPLTPLLLFILGLLLLDFLTEFRVGSDLRAILDEDEWDDAHHRAQDPEQSTRPRDPETIVERRRGKR